jgi:hypothetical protein|tara:strand:+ start:323 stop:553 length:231 start_codon:yes stop_codon:yes gene_type:complete
MKEFRVYIYLSQNKGSGPHDFDSFNEVRNFLKSEYKKQNEKFRENFYGNATVMQNIKREDCNIIRLDNNAWKNSDN